MNTTKNNKKLDKIKVLFLDIDGCCNCAATPTPVFDGGLGIDPLLAFRVGKITLEVPDLKVVLSSSWKHWKEGREIIEKKIVPIYDVTPDAEVSQLSPLGDSGRGTEIQMWLDAHPEVERYAILDDDTSILQKQLPNFFQTSWYEGLTEEIMNDVINHFNKKDEKNSK
jgi:hypothetical protein